MSKKKIADFHILGLFYQKIKDLSEKKICLSRAVAGAVVRIDLCHAYNFPFKS
jgi:hypothetical protein